MKPKRKVLVLDDEPIVCERLKPALEKIGFTVETYTESQQAIDRLAHERFDVVVTDVKMQGPDGIDVLRFTTEHQPGTKVVIITGFATVETAREAMRGGAVDFIAKPFKISQLRDLIVALTQGAPPETQAPG
jgi:DNA-binding NtrC family response regulator